MSNLEMVDLIVGNALVKSGYRIGEAVVVAEVYYSDRFSRSLSFEEIEEIKSTAASLLRQKIF